MRLPLFKKQFQRIPDQLNILSAVSSPAERCRGFRNVQECTFFYFLRSQSMVLNDEVLTHSGARLLIENIFCLLKKKLQPAGNWPAVGNCLQLSKPHARERDATVVLIKSKRKLALVASPRRTTYIHTKPRVIAKAATPSFRNRVTREAGGACLARCQFY
jgi:hypothetical protein